MFEPRSAGLSRPAQVAWDFEPDFPVLFRYSLLGESRPREEVSGALGTPRSWGRTLASNLGLQVRGLPTPLPFHWADGMQGALLATWMCWALAAHAAEPLLELRAGGDPEAISGNVPLVTSGFTWGSRLS